MSFYIGADVSSLQAMEDNGAVFYDIDGNKDDALNILKKYGVNCIRLRLFNKPTMSFDRGDYCSVQNTLSLAKRVKDKGLGLYLDFHYSDFWADWQKQTVPRDWQNKTPSELVEAVYDYTYKSMAQFKSYGAWPDIVQIGNEIGYGLLWNHGTLDNPEMMVSFLNAGIRAVTDVCDSIYKMPKIMIHIECGADKKRTDEFFSLLEKNNILDFDLIGLSYYPYWAGEYSLFCENARNAYMKFGKKVIIAETAFPYTDNSNDDMPNVVDSTLTSNTMGLVASQNNQYKVIKEIISIAKSDECIEGVFYWEPVWYQLKGVGAEKGKGNEWENQALFDNSGRALLGIKAFAS